MLPAMYHMRSLLILTIIRKKYGKYLTSVLSSCRPLVFHFRFIFYGRESASVASVAGELEELLVCSNVGSHVAYYIIVHFFI